MCKKNAGSVSHVVGRNSPFPSQKPPLASRAASS